jgi:hypothetical protein
VTRAKQPKQKQPKAIARKQKSPKRSSRAADRSHGSSRSADRADGFARVCEIALGFPGTEVSTSYGTPALKVKGKFMARLRSESEGGLAIRCDFVDRQMLLSAAPEVFFLTDHYRDSPMILVRLDQVRADALPDLVERAWRLVAPKKLIDAYDAAR